MRRFRSPFPFAAALGLTLGLIGCTSSKPAMTTDTDGSTMTDGGGMTHPMDMGAMDHAMMNHDAMPGLGDTATVGKRPTLRIVSPTEGQVVTTGDSVSIRFDLQGYNLYQDPATKKGNHVHVILDNEPYMADYDETRPFVLHHVAPGAHVLRAFASRPWHESFKNDEAFAVVNFSVGTPAANLIDPAAPFVTYSRPKGSYAGADGQRILLDYWLRNAALSSSGTRVRYQVDSQSAVTMDMWKPTYLVGLAPGKHTITLDLINGAGELIRNGFNHTVREITVEP